MKSLNEILEALEALKGNQDEEIAHQQADDLLLDVLRLWAETQPEMSTILRKIIAAWKRVDKWYA